MDSQNFQHIFQTFLVYPKAFIFSNVVGPPICCYLYLYLLRGYKIDNRHANYDDMDEEKSRVSTSYSKDAQNASQMANQIHSLVVNII